MRPLWFLHPLVCVKMFFGSLGDISIFGYNLLGCADYLATNILIPLGGLFAVLLFAWKWGVPKALSHMRLGAEGLFDRHRWFRFYLIVSIKFIAPLIIILIFLQAIGVF